MKQSQVVGTVRALWPFLRPERRHLIQAAGVTLALTAVEVTLPILAGQVVDALLAGARGVPASGPDRAAAPRHLLIAVLVIGALARGVLVAWQRTLRGRIGEAVAARLRQTVWRHGQELSMDYVRRRGPGRLSLRFVGDVRAVQRLVANGLVQISQDLVLIVAVLAALSALNWRMGLAVATLLPAFGTFFWYLNPRLRRASRRARRRRGRLSAYVSDRLAALMALKAAGRQRAESGRVRQLTQDLAKQGTRFAAINGQLQGFGVAAVAATSALLLEVAAGEISTGRLSGGDLVAFYALLGLLLPVFQRLVTANRSLQLAQVSVDRLRSTLAQRPESFGDDRFEDLVVRAGRVACTGVFYRYPKSPPHGPPVLQHVRLEARRGQVVAIAGPNGAGKSTLLELLLRFRQPDRGRIAIDDQDVAWVTLGSLRRQVGYVPQQPAVFDGTIYENVAYGLPPEEGAEHSGDGAAAAGPEAAAVAQAETTERDPRVLRAARLAGVDRLVDELPEGWETRVGQAGNALSGGQRQRIALARALVADPPILVLDEAAGDLDAETEAALATVLRALAAEKTVIVATHRSATLRLADRIYVLDAGRLVEEGDHEALVQRAGVYARLFGGEAEVVTSPTLSLIESGGDTR